MFEIFTIGMNMSKFFSADARYEGQNAKILFSRLHLQNRPKSRYNAEKFYQKGLYSVYFSKRLSAPRDES